MLTRLGTCLLCLVYIYAKVCHILCLYTVYTVKGSRQKKKVWHLSNPPWPPPSDKKKIPPKSCLWKSLFNYFWDFFSPQAPPTPPKSTLLNHRTNPSRATAWIFELCYTNKHLWPLSMYGTDKSIFGCLNFFGWEILELFTCKVD